MSFLELYYRLYNHYGAQGWWPLSSQGGYHPNSYLHALSQEEIFEVALGSILTQNTSFVSVEKSLDNLQKLQALSPLALQKLPLDTLKEAIRPSGYFNQKAEYIHHFLAFFLSLEGKTPTREKLLDLKGIGEETADSILLFAYAQPEFKVDAYTRRVLSHLGLIQPDAKYGAIKELVQKNLESEFENRDQRVEIYQEFHALFVAHAKKYYSKKPYAQGCFLGKKR